MLHRFAHSFRTARHLRQRGAVASEYAVLIAIGSVALLGAINGLEGAISGVMNSAAGFIN